MYKNPVSLLGSGSLGVDIPMPIQMQVNSAFFGGTKAFVVLYVLGACVCVSSGGACYHPRRGNCKFSLCELDLKLCGRANFADIPCLLEKKCSKQKPVKSKTNKSLG